MRRGGWIIVGLCVFVLIMAGCWNPFSSGGGDNGKGTVKYIRTRDGLLNFFANAYENRDLERYSEALHDKFQFQFTPEVAESIGLPADEPWWGKTEDVASTNNMFNEQTVTRIKMDLPDPNWFPCRVIRDPADTLDGFCTRVTPDIRVTIEEPGKEELILLVNKSWLDIAITLDPNDDELWQIIGIEESAIPGG